MEKGTGFGLLEALLISLGATLPAGFFLMSGTAISRTGTLSLVSVIITSVLVCISGLCYFELARFSGKDGSVYEYTRETFSPNTGFPCGLLWIGGLLSCAASAAVLIASFYGFHPTNDASAIIGSAIIMLAVAFLSIKPRASIKLLLIATTVSLISLAIFLSLGAKFISYSAAQQGTTSDILFSAAIMFFAFLGFTRLTTIYNAIDSPIPTIKKAMYLTIGMFIVFYVILTFVISGLSSYVKSFPSAGVLIINPFYLEAEVLGSAALHGLFTLLATIALLILIIVCILSASRTVFSMGADNELPITGKLSKKGVPINSLALCCVILIGLTFVAKFSTLVDTMSASMLLAFAISDISALNLWLKERKTKRAKGSLLENNLFPLLPIVGALGNIALFFSISTTGLTISLAILLIGGLYYTYGKVLIMPKGAIKVFKKSPKRSAIRAFER
jgi:APA family basic amino acid/polyamine antiporter